MFAVETAPFGEVVCDVECCGRGDSVLVVDEADCLRWTGGSSGRVWLDDDISTEEVAVGKDKLGDVSFEGNMEEISVIHEDMRVEEL